MHASLPPSILPHIWVRRGWSPTLTLSHHSVAATPQGCHTCHGRGRIQGPPSPQLATSLQCVQGLIRHIVTVPFNTSCLDFIKQEKNSLWTPVCSMNLCKLALFTFYLLFIILFYVSCVEGKDRQTAQCQLTWQFVFSHIRQHVQEPNTEFVPPLAFIYGFYWWLVV